MDQREDFLTEKFIMEVALQL